MSTEKLKFTPEQEAAINYRGGALLVSAAAGSGKTKVLVERLLGYIDGGEDNDINDFLIITYTRAAAAELKERILDEISERLAHDPQNRRLRRQSLLCYSAPISTIHGFCTEILRENAHLAGLTPDFRVSDDMETKLLEAETLENVLNEAYEKIAEAPGFASLVELMSAGRDDRKLVKVIIDTHTKLQSNPYPERWAETMARRLLMTGVSDVSEIVWGALLIEKSRRTAEYWHSELQCAREEMRVYPDLEKAYGTSFDATVSSIRGFITALDSGWDDACRYSEIEFPRPRGVSGYEEFKDIRLRCKKAMEKAAAVFECTSGELIEDMKAVAPALTELLRLITIFDKAYSEEKRRRGIVDFSDLEHIVLSLLINAENGEKTELAQAVSRRFKEIMVDEYQDVNAVQEMIFNAVSNDGKNIFMVGDVKQSIYRFRLADPTIFLGKYRSFADVPEARSGEGARIMLSKNFRSRAGILEAVNFVFSHIMSLEFSEMDYTEREYLFPGRTDAVNSGTESAGIESLETKRPETPVELDIIDMSAIEAGGDEEETPSKQQLEAEFIAERIAQLAANGYIPDGQGGTRRIEYSDIVILLRSVKDKAWRYADALEEHGIPVEQPSGESFFETAEIQAALSLLAVIDNPIQDIPLTSALRSPVYGFTPDELAAIRANSRDTDFFTALRRAAETDEKCAAFLNELAAFRAIAPDMPADRFIWHVYNKTGMPGIMGAMRFGEKRRENLMLLIEYARKFESSGYKGLFGFLTYVRNLRERGEDISPERGEGSGNAVRIMSIHKSKGLEFPVVILADTAKRFNNMDALAPLVVHPELGTGAVCVDKVRRVEYPTLARLAVQSKLTAETRAEELRVLYVAMTRAREKLIITAAFADAGKELSKLAKAARPGRIPPQILEETKSVSGWILLTALTRPESAFLLDTSEPQRQHPGAWDIRLIKAKAPQPAAGQPDNVLSSALPEASPEDVEMLRARFSFVYPYETSIGLPSKLTVTELKGRYADYEAAEEAETAETVKSASFVPDAETKKPAFTFERPDFITEKAELTGAERGTALHLAMQHIDFTKCGTIDGVKSELLRLVEMRLLKPEQAAAADASRITAFFETDIGKRVLRAKEVRREFKFTLLCPAGDFYPDAKVCAAEESDTDGNSSGKDKTDRKLAVGNTADEDSAKNLTAGAADKIMLQGVIDCFFEENEAITVIDFKTGYVTRETMAKKTEYYTPQLAAYSAALERITKKSVRHRVIYFFDIDTAVEV